MKKYLICLVTGLMMAAGPVVAQADAPPEQRPSTQPAQYTWDLICLAADNHWKINGGVTPTAADDAESQRLIEAATVSGKANGKDFQAVADEMMPIFMGYLNDPHAYFGLTSGEMRAYCLKVLK